MDNLKLDLSTPFVCVRVCVCVCVRMQVKVACGGLQHQQQIKRQGLRSFTTESVLIPQSKNPSLKPSPCSFSPTNSPKLHIITNTFTSSRGETANVHF